MFDGRERVKKRESGGERKEKKVSVRTGFAAGTTSKILVAELNKGLIFFSAPCPLQLGKKFHSL